MNDTGGVPPEKKNSIVSSEPALTKTVEGSNSTASVHPLVMLRTWTVLSANPDVVALTQRSNVRSSSAAGWKAEAEVGGWLGRVNARSYGLLPLPTLAKLMAGGPANGAGRTS